MGLLDFFSKRQKLSTVLPQIPFNGQVAIQQGIITWQGGDNISFVRDGYSANDKRKAVSLANSSKSLKDLSLKLSYDNNNYLQINL